jgi:4'-phosphopantetheinyl transferase
MQSALEPPTDREIHVWRVGLGGEDRRSEARAALSRILVRYLGSEWPPMLDAGPGGKPRLATAPQRLSFNLSHSAGLALVAIAPGGTPVGVDVERLKERRDLARIAARWLPNPDATAVIAAPPGDERQRLFYGAWTRHEARVKCTGAGLAGAPPGPEVTAWPVEIDAGYAAAIAVPTAAEPSLDVRDELFRR